MNSRAAAFFAAIVFFLIGVWCSWTGWVNHKSWKAKSAAYRLGGIVAIVAGAYSLSISTSRR